MLTERHNPVTFESKWRGLFYANRTYDLYINGQKHEPEYNYYARFWQIDVAGSNFAECAARDVLQILHNRERVYHIEFRDRAEGEDTSDD